MLVGVKDFHLQATSVDRARAVVPQPGRYLEVCIAIVLVQVASDELIVEMNIGRREKINITIDPAHPPHVGRLEPTAIGPAIYFDGNQVFLARFYTFRDIEFTRGHAALVIADHLAIDPEIIACFDSIKVDKDLAIAPIFGNGEPAAMGSDRIIGIRYSRWCDFSIGLDASLEGGPAVGVIRNTVTEKFHIIGHGHLYPCSIVKFGFEKI